MEFGSNPKADDKKKKRNKPNLLWTNVIQIL